MSGRFGALYIGELESNGFRQLGRIDEYGLYDCLSVVGGYKGVLPLSVIRKAKLLLNSSTLRMAYGLRGLAPAIGELDRLAIEPTGTLYQWIDDLQNPRLRSEREPIGWLGEHAQSGPGEWPKKKIEMADRCFDRIGDVLPLGFGAREGVSP